MLGPDNSVHFRGDSPEVAYPAVLPPARLKQLYRHLLLLAREFPSIKRAAIIEDIRQG